MKKFLWLCGIVLTLLIPFTQYRQIAGNGKFKTLNPSEINNAVRSRTDIETPEALIRFYYAYPKNEERQIYPSIPENCQKDNLKSPSSTKNLMTTPWRQSKSK